MGPNTTKLRDLDPTLDGRLLIISERPSARSSVSPSHTPPLEIPSIPSDHLIIGELEGFTAYLWTTKKEKPEPEDVRGLVEKKLELNPGWLREGDWRKMSRRVVRKKYVSSRIPLRKLIGVEVETYPEVPH